MPILHLLAKRSTYWIIRLAGFAALAAYFRLRGDYAFSPGWASGYLLLSALVAVAGVALLRLPDRFPALNRNYFSALNGEPARARPSPGDLAARQAETLKSGVRWYQLLLTPSEDALICVPVLLAGVSPLSALAGGAVFGFLHLARFTYFECIGKGVFYALICLLVLPHGLLTVIAGHFLTDLLALAGLRFFRLKMR